MHSKVSVALALGLGTALVWSLVSCGPTCPGASAGCDAENTAGAAGDAGTCELVEALEACLVSLCAGNGRGTPFCNCHDKGSDLSAAPSCQCIKFNAAAFCQQYQGYTAAYFSDCAARTSPLLTMCVPVQ